MKKISVLIPTKNRKTALATTLTSLLFQTYQDFQVIVSDQSTKYVVADLPTFKTLQRIFAEHNISLSFVTHLPEKGMAEHRQFLLDHSAGTYSLFLDDDCILEEYVLENLLKTIEKEQCGFVGQAVIGLSFKKDFRPQEEKIEYWSTGVKPENIVPKSEKWQRYLLHNAANVFHLQKKIHASPKTPKPYKIAWVGGCTLYNTKKLRDAGGFSFWNKLPKEHTGEDVFAQLQVMKRYGGCGILPSGVYHQELPTTVINRKINAPEFLMKK